MVKQEKMSEVEELKQLINNHSVIGVLNMRKLPSRQLQEIRKSLKAKIRMSKRSLLLRALKASNKKDLNLLESKIEGPVALLFTNENPFKLFKSLKASRSPAAAKAGDVATKDIIVQKGSTGLPPGPAISTLQKIGLKASVQGGKIAVLQDKVVAKSGDTISGDVAGVLSLLKIEPLEIGLDLSSAYEAGTVYERNVLDIDTDHYITQIHQSVQHAINLSLNTNYPTKQTIELMIQRAFMETKAVAVDANILEKEFIDDVLLKSIRQALALEKTVNIETKSEEK
jgi:large subunit ribosomal protein L10